MVERLFRFIIKKLSKHIHTPESMPKSEELTVDAVTVSAFKVFLCP